MTGQATRYRQPLAVGHDVAGTPAVLTRPHSRA